MLEGKEYLGYEPAKMQRAAILQQLRRQGCRITRQRIILLDIILNEECSCCKELYYKAHKLDNTIGKSTVYRMINLLEEIGAISRKNMYKVDCDINCSYNISEAIKLFENKLFEDKLCHLTKEEWEEVIMQGLYAKGYIKRAV